MSTNGTSLVDDVAPPGPPAAKKATSRVAQISAKIKSVATATGEKSKLNLNQKRPAPVLPQEAKRGSERAQELNKYAAGKARGEVRCFCIDGNTSNEGVWIEWSKCWAAWGGSEEGMHPEPVSWQGIEQNVAGVC